MFQKFHRRHLFLAFFIFLGLIRGVVWKPQIPFASFDVRRNVCGVVGFPNERGGSRLAILLKELTIDQKKIPGILQVFLSQKRFLGRRTAARRPRNDISVGSRICFSGVIREIRNFGTPGEFDQRRKMLSRGIWGRVFLTDKDPISISESASSYPIQKLRERFLRHLDRFSHGGNLLKMVILGIPAMTEDQKRDFIDTGLLHLLVISGSNIALLFFFSFSLLYWFFSRSEYVLLHWPIQNILIFLSSTVLFFFYFFCGGEIPILRASLMAFSSLIALWSSRPKSGFYALAVTTALIFNFIPSSLLDPSFQLSFVAVLGLCSLRFLIADVHQSVWKTLFFSTGVCAVVTAPLIIFHFHRFSLIGVLANLCVTPLMSFIILPASFLMTLFYFVFRPLFDLLMLFFDPLSRLLFSVIHLWASLPFSSIVVPSPSFYRPSPEDLTISFLSVGQGDATLLELPGGKTMLIDAGGIHHFDVGERLIAPYLWKKGIRSIDTLVLTHSDFDHTDGARFLIDHFNVREIWASQWKGGVHYEEILERAENKNIPIFLFSRKTPIKTINGVEFYFLNPKNSFENAPDNHQSLVFQCRYKNFSALFTADIEKDIEEKLSLLSLQSDILKVPHHGSKTSSSLSFLQAVKPKFAVISAGYANRFGHPHERVLRRYQDLGIPLFRTDEGGTLEIQTDGYRLFSPLEMFKYYTN